MAVGVRVAFAWIGAVACTGAVAAGAGGCGSGGRPVDPGDGADASTPARAADAPLKLRSTTLVPSAPSHGSHVRVQLAHAELSRALRDIEPEESPKSAAPLQSFLPVRGPSGGPAAHPAQPFLPDPVSQQTVGPFAMPATGANFLGQGCWTGGGGTLCTAPPDTNGAIGPNHYVQTVNLSVAVYSRSGAAVMAPVLLASLWAGYVGTNPGNGCSTDNTTNNGGGDPVVLYDRWADRWFISQLSYPNLATTGGPPSFECIAVSQTNDPTGAYYRYDYQFDAAIDDYPKFGVWPDAYYGTYNLFANLFGAGPQADLCAYDRAAMRTGAPAASVCFTQPAPIYGVQPPSADGKIPPPQGEPAPFVGLGIDTTTGAPDGTTLDTYAFHVDWTNPSNSNLTGPTSLPVAAYTAECAQQCVPEPGGNLLDALGDRMMFRLAYRNFGTHESLTLNHAVGTGSGGTGPSGVRWYELQSAPGGGAWSVFQQGTYAPNDGLWRWMGSIAEDQAQDFALGFSVANATTNPKIDWTGRLSTDALGTMGQGEATVRAGKAYETPDPTSGTTRWGDYSDMTVDPADDCTLWYTQEYYDTAGFGTWSSQIASVAFPSCAANDFSISLSPSSQQLASTGTAQYSVTTAVTKGSAETIALHVQDLPPGVTGSFAPASITAGGTSTLTLTSTAAPPTSPTQTFMVIGTASSAIESATADVIICQTSCPAGYQCGPYVDNCGATLTCGSCTSPDTCGGGGTPHVCGCTPLAACTGGRNCGTQSDGCFGTLTCGYCSPPQTCGGGGTAGVCGCTPATTCSGGQNCNTQPDGCGGTIDCGMCTAPQTCGGGSQPNVCGCTPHGCTGSQNCGTQDDGCGGMAVCGTCSPPDTCGGGGAPGVCGCTKATTCSGGQNCGVQPDGCGATLACGTCTAPETCGGSGKAGVCGCTPIKACTGRQNCGTQPDGCGGMLTCGTCAAPETCGGGGVANVCGCKALQACPASAQCGAVSNGCGGMIQCGTCASDEACVSNQCVVVDAGADAPSEAAEASAGPPPANAGSSGGCGCRVATSGESAPPVLVASLGLALAGGLRMRRRRKGRASEGRV